MLHIVWYYYKPVETITMTLLTFTQGESRSLVVSFMPLNPYTNLRKIQ